jgi:hypothetical protein
MVTDTGDAECVRFAAEIDRNKLRTKRFLIVKLGGTSSKKYA